MQHINTPIKLSRRKRIQRRIKRKMIGPVIAGTTIFTTVGFDQPAKSGDYAQYYAPIELISFAAPEKLVSDTDLTFEVLDENIGKVVMEEISSEEKRSVVETYIKTQYDELAALNGSKPSYEVYHRAVIGYTNLKAQGKVKNEKLTIIDFSLSSKKKRLWIVDMKENKILKNKLVAHGKNSGFDIPNSFSNTRHSNQSSLGFYLTGENYHGKYGLSLRLDGLETGFNSNARQRAVVMHRARYVNDNISKGLGRLGRSFGCPAIDWTEDSTQIIKDIANKSVMFIYSPHTEYLAKTKLYDVDQAFDYLQKGLFVMSKTS